MLCISLYKISAFDINLSDTQTMLILYQFM
jgi:hypothetical protein